jgi:hypothetical protein
MLAACETSKSQNPTAPSVAGPIPGVNITAPKPLEPYTGTEIVSQQAATVTLLVENPVTTGERNLWLSVEVATDNNFATIIHQADRLTPGSNGRTSYRIPDALSVGRTYYWRTRAQDGANTGPYSGVFQFQIVAQVTIDPPGLVEPQGSLTTNRPEFKAKNGTWSNTSGVIYRFELSPAADFSNLSAVVTATPGSNGTTSISLGELPWEKTYYWRAYATDNIRNSTYSEILSFKTPAAPKPVAPVPTPLPNNPSVPLGPGGRTPDPTGGRLPLPSYGWSVVQAVANTYRSDLQNSCQDSGGSWAFMDRVVDTLRTYDTRWGYNGKRGNTNDPSKDVVDYHYSAGRDEGSTDVYIIDIIGGHCGATPSAGWSDVTDVTINSGTIGKWTARGRF